MKRIGSITRLCMVAGAGIAVCAAGSEVQASGNNGAAVEQGVGVPSAASAASVNRNSERTVNLSLVEDDVIPTGNDWIALPSIRASDGALQNFNVISMRYRGLLEVAGVGDRPLMSPFVEIGSARRPLAHLKWSLRDYWIPTGTMEADGVRVRLTYVAPPASRAAIVRFQLTNLRAAPVRVAPGDHAVIGSGPTVASSSAAVRIRR